VFNSYIIDDKAKLELELSSFHYIVIPIYKDDRIHPCNQEVSAFYIVDDMGWYRYIVPINHSENAGSLTLQQFNEVISDKVIYVWDKKSFLHHTDKTEDLFDLQLLFYYNGVELSTPHWYHSYYRKWKRFNDINTIIPLARLFDEINSWVDETDIVAQIHQYRKYCSNKNYLKYEDVIRTFSNIEGYGIQHKVEGTQYTQYNLYTTTGRPSNRFGGVNFAALNKSDDTRVNYIPRHEGGRFYLYDYISFHPTIISNYLKIDRPEGKSIHQWLGEQYYNKQELTPEEYEESKRLTFYYLYGDMTEVQHIEFFRKTNDFIQSFKDKDEITTPIFKRTINTKGMAEQKIFNYFLQNLESEINFIKLKQLDDFLSDKHSKMVLYTYDSFLIDYSPQDDISIVEEIKQLLERNQFSVSIKEGLDYKNLTDIKK
jgi:hypothetical protein